MARSKFPGKPSKPVNRTRINVLITSENESTSNLNNISIKQDCYNSRVGTAETANRSVKRHVHTRKSVCKTLITRNSITKRITFMAGSNSSNSQTLRRNIRKRKDQSSENELSNKLRKTKQSRIESNNLMGKFILPSRSVHSSRVIKPNKRFINVEAVNSVQLRTFKKRVVNKKSNSAKCDLATIVHKSKCVLNTENAEYKRDSSKTSQKSLDNSVVRTVCSNGRVILRQARFQLHTQTPTGPEGPFSANNSSNTSPPGTVTCGVCGAVRFYRFVKQARKFNIYSCESCRKFISKIIKRQVNNKKLQELQCLKGQGTCHVPPIVRSQHWKFRCAYKARCNACWLKMCLRSFQIPSTLKNNLLNLLPKFMRESDTFSNTLSLFSFHTNTAIDRTANIESSIPLTPTNKLSDDIVKKRPLRKQIVKSIDKCDTTTVVSEIKRQKLDLKGPRVKHVCRSASIVLGQPLAVFPENMEKKQSQNRTSQIKADTVNSFDNDTSENKENNCSIENKNNESDILIETEQIVAKNVNSKLEVSIVNNNPKRDVHNKASVTCLTESKPRRRYLETDNNNIAIDFWENYDPEEVSKNGFGLIAALSFPMLAICYLCGSAGQDPLLYCCSCCEPYHLFCLEQPLQNINTNTRGYDWLCPKCTMCNICGKADKQKLKCQKCQKVYHPECFNNKLGIESTPTICSMCMRCKSCGSSSITKFIGNTPLCLICFQLRKKGNFCRLCQSCYDDNDYDTNMMECVKCHMWIHAKCESLSEEQYQTLSQLPESIEFLCCICEPLPYWRKVVDSELRANLNNILKLLSKNRIARNTLKWSPLSSNENTTKPVTLARKLQFTDESDVSNSSDDDNIENNQDDVRKAQNKYKLRELRIALRPSHLSNDEVLTPVNNLTLKTPNSPPLNMIKNKLNSKKYFSLTEFDQNMVEICEYNKSSELLDIYRSILKQVFPWYNPTGTETNTTTSIYKPSFSDGSKFEDITLNILEKCKYELLKNIENDNRVCCLCKGVGDGSCYQEARLLYCGNNEWIHANCALWSSEVYEEIDGSLQNVQSAITRGRHMRCSVCKQRGASIGCCAKSCHETYHFLCAHSAKCYFMQDKSIFCPVHGLANNEGVISSPSDFAIFRSIYVELDQKRKRFVEHKKVQFMVGSLRVTNLGVIVPVLSDNLETIIPINLICKRLFWSTIEPWKLVPYVITTRVLSAQNNNTVVDRNFTVDHMASRILIEKKLKEITLWQKEIEKVSTGLNDYEDEEEPQNENATDILSPELTDAILEELPHEFIDGISMQDIFPKLMNSEELLGIDFKVTDISSSESCKTDSCLQLNNEQSKRNNYFDDEKELFETIEGTKIANEIKDCKSDTLQTMNKIAKARNHQRSCNVALSCKFPTKQIKTISQDKTVFLKLLQVDGAYDSSDCENHENENIGVQKLPNEPVKCERCQCTYRTQASYKRHLTTCEEISTSESDSELVQDQEETDLLDSAEYDLFTRTTNSELTSAVEDKNNFLEEPYTVTSYKSYSSYQSTQNQIREPSLNPCTFINTDATSKTINSTQNSEIVISNFQPVLEQNNIQSLFTSPINQNIPISVNPASVVSINQPVNPGICDSVDSSGEIQSLPINEQTSLPINQIGNQQPLYISHAACNAVVNQPNSIPIVQTTPLSLNTTPLSINQTGTISLSAVGAPLHINQPVEIQPQQLTIQPVTQEIASVININPSNHIGINTKMLATPNVVNSIITPNVGNSVVTQTIPISQNQYLKPILKSTLVAQKSIKSRGRPRLLAAKKIRPTHKTVYIPQSATGGASIVLQQIPTNHMIPTFVETFQQQTGQNLQYITTVTPQITSAITAQPQIIQLQTDGTLVNLIPSVPPAVILPQSRILSDQLLVDNNGSLMWTPQTVQPVFLGFETIVQNTVLQSQQFLPSTLPGILTTNSSYSSTTQVFQTSKLEPLLEVSSGNIVLLNSTPTTNSQSFQIPQAISNPAPNTSLVITENKPTVSWNYIDSSTNSTLEQQPKVLPLTSSSNMNCNTNNNFSNSNSINLPVPPFIPEPGIPTNIVTPTPKPVQSAVQLRPMNRVLPMPTNNSKQTHKIIAKNITDKTTKEETNEDNNVLVLVKPQETNNLGEEIIKPLNLPKMSKNSEIKEIPIKEDTTSLKLVFQKQNEGGLYKISNDFNKKNTSSIQIAPLKLINTKSPMNQTELSPEEEQIENNKSTNLSMNCIKQNSKIEAKPPLEKQENTILYTVETQDGFHYSATSINDVWMKIFEAVQAARISYNMSPLPCNSLNGISGLHLLGLKSNGLKYLLEQLPDANKCTKYKPIFHTRILETDVDEDQSSGHSFGAARCLPHEKSHEPSDMFGWLASKHRKPPMCQINDVEQNTRRGSITNLPMAMRFRHLKLTSRQSVGVYHSKIHKRGLFCHRDIELGEMVIEYAGEVIRSILADKRERQYTVKGMGCYMFRIDENFVVDATMKGNAARFINHSCDPNCYSKVIEILGHKHIIIFALRKIICGEELTYDYKFPFEEDKIPCTCNSRRCRKFLN